MKLVFVLIVPLIVIFISFYYLERYNNRLDILNSLKRVTNKNRVPINKSKEDTTDIIYRTINNRDDNYPLNSQVIKETRHYQPISTNNIKIQLLKTVKQNLKNYPVAKEYSDENTSESFIVKRPDAIELKEHFNYLVGPQFDHLYH